MKKYCVVAAIPVMFVLTFCLNVFAEEVKLAGGGTVESTVISPIKVPFEQATGIKIQFLKVGSKAAFAKLLEGGVDASTADVTFDDLIAIAKKEKMEIGDLSAYKHAVIGKDRLVFFIHKDNPVTKLSKDQLKGIFTGKIQNWKDAGGKDAPILVVWGKLSSGTNSLVSKIILDGEPQIKDVLEVNTADDVKQSVATTPEGIGFGPVKMLDGTVKGPETPEVGRPLILVTKGNPSTKVQKLIDFIKMEGPKYIK